MFWQEIQTAFRLILTTLLMCCGLYPALVLGFAILVAPEQRQGSLVRDRSGQVIGSYLIAQKFTRPEYFWPRPSAVDYDASGSGGSNLSPAGMKFREQVLLRLQKWDIPSERPCPVELVTASGSGLDPHISLEGAMFQIPRIAKARGITERQVEKIIEEHANNSLNSLFGMAPMINVLEVNCLLDGKRGDRKP